MYKSLFFLLFVGLVSSVSAQQLVYKPVNPAFGGETFNYQWLLSSASAQNSIEDPSVREDEIGSLEQFNESLNSQLLAQLSRTAFADQFGTGEFEPGTFSFGSLELEIVESLNGLVINILDTTTAEQTQIIIPN
ncbi:Curli production assembly/transport component CsgF precursor [unidentified eubacterium SCB49]|nr:Curli production assembly/transport component CsgF precursor [unidentified eubacterium SCB49]